MAFLCAILVLISLTSQGHAFYNNCRSPYNCYNNNCQGYGCNMNFNICDYLCCNCNGITTTPPMCPCPPLISSVPCTKNPNCPTTTTPPPTPVCPCPPLFSNVPCIPNPNCPTTTTPPPPPVCPCPPLFSNVPCIPNTNCPTTTTTTTTTTTPPPPPVCPCPPLYSNVPCIPNTNCPTTTTTTTTPPPPPVCPCPPIISDVPCIPNPNCPTTTTTTTTPKSTTTLPCVRTNCQPNIDMCNFNPCYRKLVHLQRPICQQPKVCYNGNIKAPCLSSQNCGSNQQCCYNQCARTSGCTSGGGLRYRRATQVNHTKLIEVGSVNISIIVRFFDKEEVYEIISEKLLHLKMELSHLVNVDVIPYTDLLDCGLSTMNCLSGRLLSCTRNITEELINDKQEQQARLLSLTACLTQSAVELKERDVQASMLTMKMCVAAQDLKWKAVKSCMTKADEPKVNVDGDASVLELLPPFIVVINESIVPFSTTTAAMIKRICESLGSRGLHPDSCSHFEE